ncbi:hypothetical protein GMST_04680 [Geomonas silvestris]|uniref:histidine kinase n=1 Tax=Geomonas silvestris TaxID=2740184 RepID=A0A6V8ME88_9BACT|nr:PAS domain S-box protein [Geomonas silvestris]GFO58143.1 hypothetical protein GMST_04680 [Geomonas silvestris]
MPENFVAAPTHPLDAPRSAPPDGEEHSFRELFFCHPSPLALVDAATLELVEINRQGVELFQLGATRTAPRLTDLVSFADPAAWQAFLTAPGDQWSEFAATLPRDGGHTPFSVHLRRAGQREGRLFALFTPAAEERTRDGVYASIVAHTGIGLTVIDSSLRVVSMNPTIRSWFPQVDPGERPLCYQSFNSPPLDAPCSYCPVVKVLEDGQSHHATTATPTPEGIRHFSMIATPVLDARGEVLSVIETAEDVTDRLLLEERMLEKSRNLQAVLDNAPIAIWYKDVAGRFRFVNKTFCRQIGIAEERLLEAGHFTEVLPARVAANCSVSDEACLGQQGPSTFRESFPFSDGREHLLSVTKGQVRSDDGEVLGVVGLGIDITEQQLYAERLQLLTDSFLRFGPDFNANINILTEVAGRILGARCALFNLLEQGELHSVGRWNLPGAFSGRRSPEGTVCYQVIRSGSAEPVVIADLAASPFAAGFREQLAAGITSYLGVPVCWGDRTVGVLCALFDHEFRPTPADLSFASIVAAALAIEEDRRSSVLAQQRSERLYRALFSEAGEGVFMMTTGGIILEVNQAFADMHGYRCEEMAGMQLGTLDTPASLAGAPERIGRLSAGEHLTFEVEHYHRDGHTFSLEVSASLLECDGEHRLICFHRDITERKRHEEERRTLERQFQQAQKLESLGVLAGGVAHDFNNILAIISGYCSLLAVEPERVPDYLPEIVNATERAAELCRQMLAYAGKTQFAMSHVDLTTLVDEMVRMLKATLPQNVALRLDRPRAPLVLVADSGQLRQVLMNLIINASEAIGARQGEIRVTLNRAALTQEEARCDHLGKEIPAGFYLCLEVADDGCGMDEATRLRVFEPFFSTKFSGRGLGMSAVLGIINAHGGALDLASTPGGGTCFRIYLPAPEEADRAAQGGRQLETASRWQGSGRVLLVEDEAMVRALAATMLGKLGFEVVQAANGEEGLSRFRHREGPFRLVITDLGMPVMDGYQMVDELKRLAPGLPILITTGFGEVDVASRLSLSRVDGYLAKPYDFLKLKEAVNLVIDATAG